MNNAKSAALAAQRKALLFSRLEKNPRNKPLELIVGTSFDKHERLTRTLKSFCGIKRQYSLIPYITVECETRYAAVIANQFYNHSSVYKHDFGSVRSLDVSSKLNLPSPKIRKAALNKQDLWNLEDIGVYDALRYSSGRGVKVAVIDTGVNYNHTELKHAFGTQKGYDFIRECEDPMDLNGHGTHVAGIISGSACGVAGGASMYALRVLDENGEGSEADAIAAVEWAVKKGIKLLNCSFGSPVASRAFEDICDYASKWGVVIVAAAGNDGTEAALYPAAFGDSVISVAAVDRNNEHAYFSNICETNDISAPGVEILSAYLGGYASLDGTSMAAPHVTGALALAIAMPFEECFLEEKLCETAQKLDTDMEYDNEAVFGAGLVRADSLVKAVVSRCRYSGRQSILESIRRVVW